MDAAVPTATDIQPPRDRKSWVFGWLGFVAAALLALGSAPAAFGPLEVADAMAGSDVAELVDSSAACGEARWTGDPIAEGATEVEEEDDREGGDSALHAAERLAEATPRRTRNSERRRRTHPADALGAARARAPPTRQG